MLFEQESIHVGVMHLLLQLVFKTDIEDLHHQLDRQCTLVSYNKWHVGRFFTNMKEEKAKLTSGA